MNSALYLSLLLFLSYYELIDANIQNVEGLSQIIEHLLTGSLEQIRDDEFHENVIGEVSIRKNNYLFDNVTISTLNLYGIQKVNISMPEFNFRPNYVQKALFLVDNIQFHMHYDNHWMESNGVEIRNNSTRLSLNLNDIYIEGNETLPILPIWVRNVNVLLTLKSSQYHQELNSQHRSDGLTEYLAKIINEYHHDISPLLSIFVEFIITRIILYKS